MIVDTETCLLFGSHWEEEGVMFTLFHNLQSMDHSDRGAVVEFIAQKIWRETMIWNSGSNKKGRMTLNESSHLDNTKSDDLYPPVSTIKEKKLKPHTCHDQAHWQSELKQANWTPRQSNRPQQTPSQWLSYPKKETLGVALRAWGDLELRLVRKNVTVYLLSTKEWIRA